MWRFSFLPATVLLVEDFVPFRSFVAGLLRDGASGYVVREAGDGAEADAIASKFLPDVILMDIGLPRVNGFDAALQIVEHLPSSRIIFLTGETDEGIVQEALNLGASGYIAKHQAQSELLVRLAAVLRGENFLSSTVRRGGNSDSAE